MSSARKEGRGKPAPERASEPRWIRGGGQQPPRTPPEPALAPAPPPGAAVDALEQKRQEGSERAAQRIVLDARREADALLADARREADALLAGAAEGRRELEARLDAARAASLRIRDLDAAIDEMREAIPEFARGELERCERFVLERVRALEGPRPAAAPYIYPATTSPDRGSVRAPPEARRLYRRSTAGAAGPRRAR